MVGWWCGVGVDVMLYLWAPGVGAIVRFLRLEKMVSHCIALHCTASTHHPPPPIPSRPTPQEEEEHDDEMMLLEAAESRSLAPSVVTTGATTALQQAAAAGAGAVVPSSGATTASGGGGGGGEKVGGWQAIDFAAFFFPKKYFRSPYTSKPTLIIHHPHQPTTPAARPAPAEARPAAPQVRRRGGGAVGEVRRLQALDAPGACPARPNQGGRWIWVEKGLVMGWILEVVRS